ncbi:hypothetical protein KIH87_19395 [Paraneptunicella aestuarii]|uniref:hypothetical protein n=1 Tax=Paraneptunicella aestuarii TaxID=2831148 RepID=UPI001E36DC1D|nr:hypothetical protein [Paraneptunicella aestuarii]UAA38792.1 hypothetical protein KIH87_19395 [Paraneptunicella aestuarii]
MAILLKQSLKGLEIRNESLFKATAHDASTLFSSLDQEHKAMFSEAIFRRKSLTWNDIKSSDRHGLGTEKIPKTSINAPIPRFKTEDIENFLVFRYHGKDPMVGYRQKDIFFVLWFDHNFTLYDH